VRSGSGVRAAESTSTGSAKSTAWTAESTAAGSAIARPAKSWSAAAGSAESPAARPAESWSAGSPETTSTGSAESTSTRTTESTAVGTAGSAATAAAESARPAAGAGIGEAIPAAWAAHPRAAAKSETNSTRVRVAHQRLRRLSGCNQFVDFRPDHDPFFVRGVKLRLDGGRAGIGRCAAAASGRLRHRQDGQRHNRQ
jgi:hypothetical protein